MLPLPRTAVGTAEKQAKIGPLLEALLTSSEGVRSAVQERGLGAARPELPANWAERWQAAQQGGGMAAVLATLRKEERHSIAWQSALRSLLSALKLGVDNLLAAAGAYNGEWKCGQVVRSVGTDRRFLEATSLPACLLPRLWLLAVVTHPLPAPPVYPTRRGSFQALRRHAAGGNGCTRGGT